MVNADERMKEANHSTAPGQAAKFFRRVLWKNSREEELLSAVMVRMFALAMRTFAQ